MNTTLKSIVRTTTFESLLTIDKLGSIPNGFAGLNWINARYTNEENARAIRPNKNSSFLRGCQIMSVNHSENLCKLYTVARKDKISIYSKTIMLRREISKVIEFNS